MVIGTYLTLYFCIPDEVTIRLHTTFLIFYLCFISALASRFWYDQIFSGPFVICYQKGEDEVNYIFVCGIH
jgi:hypothetical protein